MSRPIEHTINMHFDLASKELQRRISAEPSRVIEQVFHHPEIDVLLILKIDYWGPIPHLLSAETVRGVTKFDRPLATFVKPDFLIGEL